MPKRVVKLVLLVLFVTHVANSHDDHDIDRETMAEVMRKMEEYCSREYRDEDAQTIELYSECFSKILKAVSWVGRGWEGCKGWKGWKGWERWKDGQDGKGCEWLNKVDNVE